MSRPTGNHRLKAARQHAGYPTQQAFAEALTQAAPRAGLGRLEVSVRQVRRWESDSPPWPRADHQRLLVHVLQLPIEQLGFTAPWDSSPASSGEPGRPQPAPMHTPGTLPLPRATAPVQPATIGADYATITVAHRRLY